jgi:small-conductance mechanosensitive channel
MEVFKKIIFIILLSALLIKINQKTFKEIIKKRPMIYLRFLSGMITAIIALFGTYQIGMQFEATKEIATSILKNSALIVAVAGFAAQQTLNNIISGLMISIAKPFDIGERVHLVSSGITGIIEDITLRHTIIKSFDNQRIVIPNSVMNNEILKNSNFEDSVIGNYFELTITYESDLRKVITVFHDIIVEHPLIITNDTYQPNVTVKDLSDTGIVLKATIWTKDVSSNFKASSDIRIELIERFKIEGIEIPYKILKII